MKEKRRHKRIKTLNEIDYVLLNPDRKKIDTGRGRTLNLSQSGALLETQKPLKGPYIILITLNLKGDKIKVKGRVAYSRQSDETKRFLTGIQFLGSKGEQLDAVVTFVKAHYRRKYSETAKPEGSLTT